MKRVGQLYREVLANRIKDGLENKENAFLVSYTELSSIRISDLRKKLKEAGADVHVSRNTIAQKILKDLDHEKLAEKVSGQTAFVWSSADSAAVSKMLIDFTKECETFVVQGGLLDGRVLEQSDVKKLSELPPREVLLSTLLGTIQAPLTRLAGALNAKSRDLLSILKQYSEKKGGS